MSLWSTFFLPQQAHAVCDTPDLLIVVDNSCSMAGTNWSAAVTAVNTITNQYNGKLRFGLETFNSGATIRYGIPTCVSAGNGCGAGVRSAIAAVSPSGGTSLTAAISTADSHLSSVKASDAVPARKRSVLFLTDGQATCAQTQVATLNSKGIKTYVIGFGTGVDANCLNNMATNGGTALSGSRKYYQADNSNELSQAMAAIANAASVEICNGLDDDCDGKTDENITQACSGPCGAGVQVCQNGNFGTCSTARQPSPEVCDGVDNDCNGQIDDGNPGGGVACNTGQQGACSAGTRQCQGGTLNCVRNTAPSAEKCNGKDDDCDGKTDEAFGNLGQSCNVGVGACQRTGTYVCASNQNGVSCSVTPAAPQPEICDGKDNDCDGKTDEDFGNKGQPCVAGTGACESQGTYICKSDGSATQCSVAAKAPTPEVCDGVDNDCNGQIDEGLNRSCQTACETGIETCTAGQWQSCTARKPSQEICNNQDDDCDGKVDDFTRPCSTVCGTGVETCISGRWINCTAQAPVAEDCNGKDDDCDGKTDEGLAPRQCQAACGQGTASCQGGAWTGCSGPPPQTETCNGKDDDCDGTIDEDVFRDCKTDCGAGKEICVNGAYQPCNAPKPRQEICDGKDEDCDGTPDNNAVCPQGLLCKDGKCQAPCRGQECPAGLSCQDGICVGRDLCVGVTCATGEICLGGRCVDPCSLLQCASGEVCVKGQCIPNDCYVTGCPSGTTCMNGQCQSDPCFGISCASGEFCKEGKCVASCTGVTCAADEVCKDGKCEKDPTKSGPCAGVTCADGEVCKDGKCEGDPCANVECPQGRYCKDGTCNHDPCVNVTCPSGQTCKEGQCSGGSTNPDGNNQPDGGSNPDGTVGPDGTIVGPDGTVVGPDGTVVGPDGTIVNPENTANQENDTNDGKNIGGNSPDDPSGEGRYQSPGCSCQQQSGIPASGLLLFIVLSLLVLRRRRFSA
ncbi:MAG: VWA domain-containing protein [Myxococcales bacterium]|nr:VWA domain-containing protein [Myxococcales bacterium]